MYKMHRKYQNDWLQWWAADHIHTRVGVVLCTLIYPSLWSETLVYHMQDYSIPGHVSPSLSCQMVRTSGACERHLNCSINCLCAEKQYLKERLVEDVTPCRCNYMKSSGQLALSAMWHCCCLCDQLQLLTVGDHSLICIIEGLVINGNGVWEDPIKIWSEIWSSPLLCAIYLQLHWHIRNYWDCYPHT